MRVGAHIQRGFPPSSPPPPPCSALRRAPCPLHSGVRSLPVGPTHRPGSPRGGPARPAPAAGAAGAPGDPWPWPGRGQDAGHPARGAAASGQEPRLSEDTPTREEREGAGGGSLPSAAARWGPRGGEGLGRTGARPWGAGSGEPPGRSGGCGGAESPVGLSRLLVTGRGRDASASCHRTADSQLIQGHLPEGVSNFYVPRNHLEIFLIRRLHSCRSGGQRGGLRC